MFRTNLSSHNLGVHWPALDTWGQLQIGSCADSEHSLWPKKAGAVFVDLAAACDSVWHRSLTCKLLRLLLDRRMVHMIMEQVDNRSFSLTTGNNK